MADHAIEVRDIGKRYWLGSGAHLGSRHRPRRGPMARLLRRPVAEELWALRNVSFDVSEGEAVGIIGRNGAGKSTLFKLLSRVTAPTEGSIRIRGRVGALLEAGTGFNGELTGRENVYLSGVILGMSRQEVSRLFHEIVEFAGVERFIDTPFKRYSSGMGVRLAFSVAAHLTAPILVVDEVLAVGDAEFQAKCLGKMDDVTRGGRTVMFVSHNMNAIANLCPRCIVLEKGGIRFDGASGSAIREYYDSTVKLGHGYVAFPAHDRPAVTAVRLEVTHPPSVHEALAPLSVVVALSVPRALRASELSVRFMSAEGIAIAQLRTSEFHKTIDGPGSYEVRCEIARPRLYQGRYSIEVRFTEGVNGDVFDVLHSLCPFEIVMHSVPRDIPWQPGECVYFEEGDWTFSGGPDLHAPRL